MEDITKEFSTKFYWVKKLRNGEERCHLTKLEVLKIKEK